MILLEKGKKSNYMIYKFKDCNHIQEIRIDSVRNRSFKCRQCIEEKLNKEAQEVGVVLLGKGKTGKYRLYQFKECGHKQEIQVSGIRSGYFKCQQCFDQRLNKEAEDANLLIIDEGKNSDYRLYQFKKCVHEQEIPVAKVRTRAFKCRQCSENKLNKEAIDVGLKLIDKSKKLGYRKYKFEKCGHIQEIHTTSVRNNEFKCKQCSEDKLNKEAIEAGLELVGKGKNKDYRLYKFKGCGHTQEIQVSGVRKGNPKCEQCLAEKLNKEAESSNLLLIGKRKDTKYRLYQFKKCGHKQELQIGHVREGRFECKQCFYNKLEEDADKCGVILIGESKKNNYRLYQFKKCGHQQEIHLESIRKKTVNCQTCYESELEDEAKKKGLLLIGKGAKKDHRLYQFTECRHIKEITPNRVRENNFKCQECYEKKLQEEAKEASLLLIDNSKEKDFRIYKFKDCGHIQKIRIHEVRKKSFRCHECKGLKLENGIIVRSMAEKLVGDWLIKNNICFEYEKRLSNDTMHKTDFYIIDIDVYIEVVGFENNFNGYMDDFNKKVNMFYSNKNLLQIMYSQILSGKWEEYLRVELSKYKY